jgi:hypothetical protein
MRIETERRAPVSRSPLVLATAIVAACLFCFVAGAYWIQPKADLAGTIKARLGMKAGSEATGLYASVPDGAKHMGKADKTAPPIAGLKRIYIKIKHNDFESLRIQKEMSLKEGKIVRFDDPYVRAEVSTDDKAYLRGKLRIRGLTSDHVATDKDSYRIELANKATIFQLNKFSLHHPWMRNYMHEMFIHKAMQREGLPFLRYEFVHVTINGVPKGIYAMEENFDNLLTANNELGDGAILDFSNAQTTVFKPGVDGRRQLAKNGKLLGEYEKASTLLHRFIIGDAKASDVFDVNQVAMYCALTDLTAAYHGAHYSSVRFFYNPTTSRFQFLPYDETSNFSFDYLIGAGRSFYQTAAPTDAQSPFFKQLFDDTDFYRLYVRALEKVSAPAYVDALMADLRPELVRSEAILKSEWPEYGFFDKWYFTPGTSSAGFIKSNAERIRKALDVSSSVEAHLTGVSTQSLTLSLANTSRVPVEVLGVRHAGGAVLEPTARPLILAPMTDTSIPAYRKASFSGKVARGADPAASSTENLVVTYKVLGGSTAHDARVDKGSYDPEDLPRQVTDLATLPWLRVDRKARLVSVVPGKHTLDKPLSLAEGYSLGIGPATTIQLANKAFILVNKGRLIASGSEAAPVVIESPDGSGTGVVVLFADGPSQLSHVIFDNLKNPVAKGWDVTGCVTFYESPVSIDNTQFMNCGSEDSLHIVRTRFSMNGVTFKGAFSDAFDGDFVQGSISGSKFLGSGNDAIDISGSKVTITDVSIANAGDKGLSAGERSFADLTGVRITDSKIGVASKDNSSVTIDDLAISGGEIGLSVFQKKPEFGPGRIVAKKVAITGNKQPYLVEYGSTITVDDKAMTTNAEMVRGMLYPQKKPK